MMKLRLICLVMSLALLLACGADETEVGSDDIFSDLPTPPPLSEEKSDEIVGQAFYVHETGYASPFNVHVNDQAKARVFSVTPKTADLAFEDDQLSFNILVDGHPDSGYVHAVLDPVLYYDEQKKAWQAIPLTGDAVGTPFQIDGGFQARWLRHSGSATVNIPTSALPDGALYFVSFSCWRKTKNDPWLCGPQ